MHERPEAYQLRNLQAALTNMDNAVQQARFQAEVEQDFDRARLFVEEAERWASHAKAWTKVRLRSSSPTTSEA